MFSIIKNDIAKVEVNSLGAELSGIKIYDVQYIWQGNPEVWSGRAPILFPVVGRLLNDEYSINSRKYSLQKHGFVKNSEFELVGSTQNSLVYLLKSNNSIKEFYPYDFELYIYFTLNGNSLDMNYKVVNNYNTQMLFSIGAHPAFNCEIGDYIKFETKETLDTYRMDTNGILIESKPFLNNEDIIVITNDIFADDAVMVSDFKSKSATLVTKNAEIKVGFNNAKYLGFWAKPGASYVCIEPWQGINDSYNTYGDFSNKPGILKLKSGEAFEFKTNITINNK